MTFAESPFFSEAEIKKPAPKSGFVSLQTTVYLASVFSVSPRNVG